MAGNSRDPAPGRKLGEYLDCAAQDLELALRRQAAHPAGPRIGELLVSSGAVSAEALRAGLEHQRADRLSAIPLFAELAPEDIRRLSRDFDELSIAAGEQFITQDAVDPHLYILISGSMEMYRVDDDGERIVLAQARPGEPIGEMGFFTDGTRSASVRALERCEVLRINFTNLGLCFDRSPQLARSFLRIVTDRLRQTNVLYQDTVHRRRTAEKSLRHLNEFLDLSETEALGVGIEGLIERLVHTASRIMDADRASLFLLDQTTGELWSKVAEGSEVREIRVPRGVGVAGWVARHGELVNIPDAYEDQRFNQAVDRRTGYRTRSILCGPIWSLQHEMLGVVQVINKASGSFDQDDEQMFRAFAHQAAIAVENFTLYRKMVSNHEKMVILLDIATSIGQTLDLNTLISRIVAKIAEALRCERSAFFVVDRERDELWSMEAHGSELKEIRFPASAGLAGHTATTGEVLNIEDAYADGRFNPEIDRRTGYRTRNVLCAPVRSREGRVIGVTQAINKETGGFGADDVDLLRAISAQIAVSVENAQLHADTLSMKQYLERVQESISNSLITIDNSYRVVTANRVARAMLGTYAAAILGVDIRELLGAANRGLYRLLDSALANHDAIIQYDLPLHHGAHESTRVNANIFPMVGKDGGSQGLVLVLEDITREMRVRTMLARYVMHEDMVERLLKDPRQQRLGGVRSTATVMFTDIRGFTSIAEALSAEATMDLLNEYFSLMVEEVYRHRGLLGKFVGDAIMAVFGLPYPQDDDAPRAVMSALGMSRALDGYNQRRAAHGLAPIQIGIGINTDSIISGNIGSEQRMDYTVIGDGVNISSRLEGLNKHYGTRILVSDSTRRLLGDAFALRLLDNVVIKGKSRPIEIYEVLGPQGTPPAEVHLRFADGFGAYREGDFAGALDRFRLSAEIDPPSRVFAERCEALLREPPRDWDGVWRATEK
jgi:adenylate cyclase